MTRATDDARDWSPHDIHTLSAEQGVPVLSAPEARESAGGDFGRLVQRSVQCVFAPRSASDVERIVAYANQHRLKLTARGRGMSQGGQSIPLAGVSVDLSHLTGVDAPELSTRSLRCSAGTTWRDAVAMSTPHGLIPKVLPLNLDLTVGGLLSVAGVGATSHRHGAAVSCVRELEVVSGAGRRVVCSPASEPETYAASLGGMGRATLIVRANIELRPFKPKVRTFYLLFDQIEAWLAAQRALIAEARADYLEGFCSPCVQGLRQGKHGRAPFAQWFYALHVSIEYSERAPDVAEVLTCASTARVVHQEDNDTIAYAARYDSRFVAMRRSGAWTQPHPWVEAMLPGEKLVELLPQILALYPATLGDGPRLIFIERLRIPPFLSMPDSPEVACCALLPTGLPPHTLHDTLDAFHAIHDLVIAAGGKRVLSGWTAMMDQDALDAHYGQRSQDWAAARRSFDPAGVLDSPVSPNGVNSVR